MSRGDVEVSLLLFSSGTYVRDATGLVTISLEGHGLNNTDSFYVKFTTGKAISALFQECAVVDANHFSVQTDDLSVTSGSVLVSKLLFDRSGTYLIDTVSLHITLDIPGHGLPDGSDIYVRYLSGLGESGPAVIREIINTDLFTVVKKNNPGGFYGAFGVKQFHEQLHYGAGVKVYVIDEGFNDIDLTTPGIQTTSELAEYTIVNISNPGAGGGGLSHGGLVCALLGASRRNGAGIIGICPDAQLFLADVDDTDGDIFISTVVSAIDDAIARGVDIINISLGSRFDNPAMAQAVQRAINASILVFASAGNSGKKIYEYPASYPGVISVASVNIRRRLSSFNTQNDRVSLFAPGEQYPLPSPLDTQDIVYVNGTSFSSPFAAGLAALYISRRRQELLDPTFRPSSSEIVDVLRGESFLATASIDSSEATSGGIAFVIIGIAIVLVALLLFGLTPTKTVQKKVHMTATSQGWKNGF